jgi:hypothetical protein
MGDCMVVILKLHASREIFSLVVMLKPVLILSNDLWNKILVTCGNYHAQHCHISLRKGSDGLGLEEMHREERIWTFS